MASTPMRTADEPGMGTLELFPIPHDEATLFGLLREIFAEHWHEIVFGSLIQGAVFELQPREAPTRIGMLDGYLTVAFGSSH